ncbi:hypothetical protein FIV42_02805 [Persicimonas caeni]|uniref:Uncharacterized protein n=1 Tax=Persicimonas caeni TaxID=2292766 RepID=A0A4Y6PPL0_PERCE|nr:hypothetical protein [Persicimonas caeni]QDG49705.1 hypothetical protein FIV42_02805 [Persicimonas caeni]QED30926.1 hypothetical protein FRD00_02800 [Persicimonas caeni]
MLAVPKKYLFIVVSVLFAAALTIPASATACSFPPPNEFAVEDGPAPNDVALPKKPELSVDLIKRGRAPEGSHATSCDDIGQLILRVEPVEPSVGYELKVLGGEMPQPNFWMPDYLVEFDADGTFLVTWIDGNDDAQEAFDFTVVATPVDRWGRRGPSSDPLHITHAGRSGAACSVAPGSLTGSPQAPLSLAVVVSLAAGLLVRRKLG